ncbi:CoA-substrate-specific enzyme activase, putative [Carboxydocella sporoproducens DSM 16521]|uniref:CoA-substrate-specific enzyme activase, putative n=2 Tax=Carboxydocella TaxID=178898 RepID=A0A1T4S5D9_9FIRM|nr:MULTISPECIES: acyl-CoA dehydratase activase [Carboxydocella]AVX21513.1 CoA-substrate-specific enzyme activase, putative [Carboxydocella thermautotrophica]SKA23357.1 CoA-substrate-specific enzyme activase, putative [Carboxydocella sporoproducens DSM 16521]
MYFAGVDVGSTMVKAIIINQTGEILARAMLPTSWQPQVFGETVLEKAVEQAGIDRNDLKYIIGTGYGRTVLPFIHEAITEITCHGKGASFLYPQNDLVIDIGGQDSKAIKINPHGKVLNFVMNDKCAAGTGRFLQMIVANLGMEIEQIHGIKTVEPVAINSMCAVFAESEIIGLMTAGIARERIIWGVFRAITSRITGLVAAMEPFNRVTFTGGVARLRGMQKMLAEFLGKPVDVPLEPHLIGALGAALLARERYQKSH